MKSPTNRQKGSAAQSAVKSRFEMLGWGVAPNDEHDLGTDLWVMARDEQQQDLQHLVGVQVKTGATPFHSAARVNGRETGWWFRENNDNHFTYWVNHSIPHILVLHRLEDGGTYWVHVTQDKVVSTGKGRKIFVPADNTLDAEHLNMLLGVALYRAALPEYQGSAWDSASGVPEAALLRYAMMTPRLVAPHGNRNPDSISAPQAIGLLVQMRLHDLGRWQAVEHRLLRDDAATSSDWQWRFYAALHSALLDDDIEPLGELLPRAPGPVERAAVVAALAAMWLENEGASEALAVVEATLETGDLNPVDTAWMEGHRARLLVDQGDTSEGRAVALRATRIGRIAPADPTAALISGAASNLVFSLGRWNSDSLASAVRGKDNVGAWWRAQTLVTALGKQMDEAFKLWSHDKSVTWGAEDVVRLRLRSAMILSGHSSDTPAWRNAASLLARRTLMTTTAPDEVAAALDLLRLAGDDTNAILAATRLLEVGPVAPLAQVVNLTDISASTSTTLLTNIRLVASAADVLSPQAADRHARWALALLDDPSDFEQRWRPRFLVVEELVRLLQQLTLAVSHDGDAQIRKHVAGLDPVTDASESWRYAELVRTLTDDEWSVEQIRRMRVTAPRHGASLTAALDRVLAANDAGFRLDLAARTAVGDIAALDSYGDVRDLPPEAANGMIDSIRTQVHDHLDRPTKHVLTGTAHDLLRVLVMLNMWHPTRAHWDVVTAALASSTQTHDELAGTLDLLARAPHRVPDHVRVALRVPLLSLTQRSRPRLNSLHDNPDPLDPDSTAMPLEPRTRAAARVALAALFPDTIEASDLVDLTCGDTDERTAVVRILIAKCDPDALTTLAALSLDRDAAVRVAVAQGLAEWIANDIAGKASAALLDRLLDEPGTTLGRAVSQTVMTAHNDQQLQPLLSRLRNHPSAFVRWRANYVLRRIDRAPR